MNSTLCSLKKENYNLLSYCNEGILKGEREKKGSGGSYHFVLSHISVGALPLRGRWEQNQLKRTESYLAVSF